MNVDNIDRFSGEPKEPEVAFICERIGCRNIIRIGQPCYDNRYCEDCGRYLGFNDDEIEPAEKRL